MRPHHDTFFCSTSRRKSSAEGIDRSRQGHCARTFGARWNGNDTSRVKPRDRQHGTAPHRRHLAFGRSTSPRAGGLAAHRPAQNGRGLRPGVRPGDVCSAAGEVVAAFAPGVGIREVSWFSPRRRSRRVEPWRSRPPSTHRLTSTTSSAGRRAGFDRASLLDWDPNEAAMLRPRPWRGRLRTGSASLRWPIPLRTCTAWVSLGRGSGAEPFSPPRCPTSPSTNLSS